MTGSGGVGLWEGCLGSVGCWHWQIMLDKWTLQRDNQGQGSSMGFVYNVCRSGGVLVSSGFRLWCKQA
jgi:hypothetical protein